MRTSSPTSSSTGSLTQPPATPVSQLVSSEQPRAGLIAKITSTSPTTCYWTPPRMRGPKSNSEVSTRSHPTSASSTRLCANTGRLGPARFTSAILTERQMTRGPNGLCERTSRRWHSTTFWKRRERVGTGSIPLLIRQQHRRWSDSSVVSYPQQHSLNPIVRSPVAREPANRCSRGVVFHVGLS